MSKDEIVLALRCCASLECEYECRTTCAFYNTSEGLAQFAAAVAEKEEK